MADVSGLEPPQRLRWSEQCCPISGVPSIVGSPVLGTQLTSNRTVPPPFLYSLHLFFRPFFPAFSTRKLRLLGPVPTPRAADSALCSGGCSLEWGASLQGWLNALGMLFRQGHTEAMPVWAW